MPADASPKKVSAAAVAGGLVAMAVAVAASIVLVYAHFKGASLPGCGEGSGCAALTSGPWGRVPGIGLPVSFVGLGYFLAAAIGWCTARGVATPVFRWIARLGAAASVFYVVLMIAQGEFCVYCTTAHVGNLVFWVVLELSNKSATGVPGGAATQPMVVAGVFLAATAGMFVADRMWGAAIAEREQDELEQSQQAISRGTGNDTPGEPFTGRYLLGPEEAAIRIVILSDYQCPDCRMIEQQVRTIMAGRPDVSFSAKHFPMSSKCNRFVTSDPHPNACWAARAAETAGILRGHEGFWEMHHLLFDRRGSFTDAELTRILGELGYDVNEFLRIMQSDRTLTVVQDDIEEGRALGLHFTPMVFVNGVELKGFRVKDALIDTVAKVAATSPEPKSAAFDQPPMARQKYIDDWRERPVTQRPGAEDRPHRGVADGRVDVVMWGDLSSSFSAQLDEAIRRRMAERDDVSYRFMNFPVSKPCNPRLASERVNPASCLTAKAILASEQLGGADAFWAMYDWLVRNHQGLQESGVVAAAVGMGLDEDAFRAALASPEIANAVVQEAEQGSRWGVGRFVPAVFVDGKWVPRWRLEGEDVLGEIFAEAAGN